MTPEEIFEDALVPGTKSVLVLGSFERRVTVYAQQVRALNLVDALLSQNVVREDGKVAIVGGGAAGVTAAVALSKAAPNLKALDLFEARADILQLQKNSTRYLHPHFYDWPSIGSEEEDAGLPIMNWTAGAAGDVVKTLWSQFDEACGTTRLNFYPNSLVTSLKPSAVSTVRVVTAGTAVARIYDAVILAIGFGLEAFLDGDTDSYWKPSALAGAMLVQMPEPSIFISGNGDGGLVDFQMAAFDALDHRAIYHLISNLDLGDALTELRTIEAEAWAPGANVNLLDAYQTRVKPLIPAPAWASIIQALRNNVRIRLHTNETQLLRKTSALHNRLATFLIVEADREIDRNAITVTTGAAFTAGAVPATGPISLVGEAPFTPYRRFLRLGADSASNLAPFEALLATYPGRVLPKASATRPESPTLTASAQARFAPFAPVAAPPPLPAQAAVGPGISHIVLLSQANSISWSGDLAPTDVDMLWSGNHGLSVYVDVPAADAGGLIAIFARLGCHAASFNLHVRDAQGWRTSIASLCASRSLPGPDVGTSCVINDWNNPPAAMHRATLPITDLSHIVSERLDLETLRQLHGSLYDVLGPPNVEMGWPIEVNLKQQLWSRWLDWHHVLQAEPAMRRRFLLLLATEQDHDNITPELLIRVGPRSLRPFLTKPTIFGLTFAVCSEHAVSPIDVAPGNMAGGGLTGHACGVGWMDGRDVSAGYAARQAWTTGVVLLAQLKEAFRLAEGDVRFDHAPGDRAKVGDVLIDQEPLVIGADELFVMALEAGEQSMQQYLRSVFRWRATTNRASLE
ncbi:ABC-three component system protein [Sinorhizobium medicae]|uniref:ABC-three component system protein n=1 Tax=Sinorhizobium medicae TaxID=110321 RepID=UPI000FD6DA67|nr:ABC-three component system protein [Sinorhizobium medicae]RVJ73072.1 hypothetical protein CN168_26015 [Sinorhizobium medicae]